MLSVTDVKHIKVVSGQANLKHGYKYPWQVQGQLAVTGLDWYDFITSTRSDITVVRDGEMLW